MNKIASSTFKYETMAEDMSKNIKSEDAALKGFNCFFSPIVRIMHN